MRCSLILNLYSAIQRNLLKQLQCEIDKNRTLRENEIKSVFFSIQRTFIQDRKQRSIPISMTQPLGSVDIAANNIETPQSRNQDKMCGDHVSNFSSLLLDSGLFYYRDRSLFGSIMLPHSHANKFLSNQNYHK
jgi:hypothetical protein